MSIFLRIPLGVAIVAAGFFMVFKTTKFVGFFGRIDWAERKLGGGGSYMLYKIIGIVLCLVGILVATNLWDNFLQATLGSWIPR